MNRGKVDIVASILMVTKKDSLKHHIMSQCRLSSKLFNDYVPMLLEIGLLSGFPAVSLQKTRGPKVKCRMFFHISKSGERFLELYSQISSLMVKR